MNNLIFAMGAYVFLDALCFVLTLVCGYFITKHFMEKHIKQSGFWLSIFVGIGVGVLLILEDGYVEYHLPQYGRIAIGLIDLFGNINIGYLAKLVLSA